MSQKIDIRDRNNTVQDFGNSHLLSQQQQMNNTTGVIGNFHLDQANDINVHKSLDVNLSKNMFISKNDQKDMSARVEKENVAKLVNNLKNSADFGTGAKHGCVNVDRLWGDP